MGHWVISRLGLLRAAIVVTVGLFFMWLGNASTAADNIHEYRYNDRLDFSDLAGDMFAVPLTDVVGSAIRDYWFPFLNLIMIASVLLAAIAVASGAIKRTLLIVASLITLPYGLLGLLTLGDLAVDGEWVAEGWFHLNTFAVWSVMLWLLTASQFRRTSPATARAVIAV